MELNRIKFLGNPWAKGHAIRDFFWSARLEPFGIWFDLHLQTAQYDAEDNDLEEVDESQDDWQSQIVWNNYHQCTLSSNYWDGIGFQVAAAAQPLNFEALSEREFLVDPLPVDFNQPRPFDIYLLGHDSVANHRIRFTQQLLAATSASKSNYFSVDWCGRIALSYSGSYEFRYEFEAHIESTEFEGIKLPGIIQEQEAWQRLAPFVTNLDAFYLTTSGGEQWFRLR